MFPYHKAKTMCSSRHLAQAKDLPTCVEWMQSLCVQAAKEEGGCLSGRASVCHVFRVPDGWRMQGTSGEYDAVAGVFAIWAWC